MLESSVTEIAVAAVTVAVGAAFYFGAPKPSEDGTVQPDQDQTSTVATSTSKKTGKKNKKKVLPGIRATSGEDTAAEEPPASIPLKQKEKEVTPKPEVPPTTSTASKKKKKKAKAAPVPSIETTLSQTQTRPSASANESSSANDGAWTRVETRRKAGQTGAVLSDGLTTSVTGTEDEADDQVKQQRTSAERVLPAGRKTGVEDMLETPQYPEVARVMRVKSADEPQPAPGLSWGDYEDGDENKVISMDDEETDEGGWGVVKSRKPKRSQTVTQSTSAQAKTTSDSSAVSKKQRQNAAKRDATKAAKADAEEERLAKLQAHKRALERERIAEAYAKPAAGKGKASGGMTASVNEKGSLVWD